MLFLILFYEGLIGGGIYVNTFAAILENESAGPPTNESNDNVPDREFALGAATVADSLGICAAGFLGIGIESSICAYQVRHGRDWCTKI